jgi:hypothetical protein
MKAQPSPDTTELHRALKRACRELQRPRVRLRYLPPPSPTRWIAEALIDHHRVIEKIRADIPAGSLTLQNIDGFADQPIARGFGGTPTEALKKHAATAMATAAQRLNR